MRRARGAQAVPRLGGLLLALGIGLAAGCDDDEREELAMDASTVAVGDARVADAGSSTDGALLPPGCAALVNDVDCDKSLRPIVFIHGTVANGDSFAHPAQFLASNGYCPERIRAVEYHSLVPLAAASDAGAPLPTLDGGIAADAGSGRIGFTLDRAETYRRAAADVDRVIEELRRETGFDKVDLAGHSQGAGHGSVYAGMNPDKVAHYVHLAGQQLEADPGGVPTMCVSSIGDAPRDCKTTKNVQFQDRELDHSAVASATEAAIEIYKFLTGKEPRYREVQCGSPIVLEGRAPTFAENTFLPGSKVEIYELGSQPRVRGPAAASFTIASDGKFGPFEAKRAVHYEFRLVPQPGDTTRRPSRAYMPPFKRSDRLLRFNFETKDPVASATSAQVNRDPSFATVIPRSRQKAFLYGRDSLKVNGFEILNASNTWNAATNRSTVTVAFYLYDQSLTPGVYGPGDMKTTGASIISGAFVNSADVFLQASTPAWIDVSFNGTSLKIPNYSVDEGYAVVFVN